MWVRFFAVVISGENIRLNCMEIRAPPLGSSFQKIIKMENQRMKDIKYIIADNVKLYRKKQKLTQMKLAELADLSVDSIKRIEAGQRREA